MLEEFDGEGREKDKQKLVQNLRRYENENKTKLKEDDDQIQGALEGFGETGTMQEKSSLIKKSQEERKAQQSTANLVGNKIEKRKDGLYKLTPKEEEGHLKHIKSLKKHLYKQK